MGIFSKILDLLSFNWPRRSFLERDSVCSEENSGAPSAKRFKFSPEYLETNQSKHVVFNTLHESMNSNQINSVRRKIPIRRSSSSEQVNQSDSDNGDVQLMFQRSPEKPKSKSVYSFQDECDEIKVYKESEDEDEVVAYTVVTKSSPCSSATRQRRLSPSKSELEKKCDDHPVFDISDDSRSDKENNDDEVQVIEMNSPPSSSSNTFGQSTSSSIYGQSASSNIFGKKTTAQNELPRWFQGIQAPGTSILKTPSAYLLKKPPRPIIIRQIEKLKGREEYCRLLKAELSSNVTSCKKSSLFSSDPDIFTKSVSSREVISSNGNHNVLRPPGGSLLQRYISIENQSNGKKSFLDIDQASNSNSSTNSFRFLRPGPQKPTRCISPVRTMSRNPIDEMVKWTECLNIHQYDANIRRRELELEKVTEKVKSIDTPAYEVLIENVISMRKVPIKYRSQKKVVEDKLPEITEDLEELISKLSSYKMNDVVSKINLEEITKDQLVSLNGPTWLKDNVINCYMALIMERCKEKQDLAKVYGFNTFFFSAYSEHGYSRVKRWTRKVDLFSFDMILIPVHVKKMHWCLAVIDFKKKTIFYYDSMNLGDYGCLKRLLTYLGEEHLDKKKSKFDYSEWTSKCLEDIPQQVNGYDCGVFASTFAEYISRNGNIQRVNQSDMKYYRKKMMVEILSKKLLT